MAQCTAQKCDFSCNDEVAVLYCKGCSRRVCLKCKLNVHDKVQQFKDHEVVSIEEKGNLVFRPQPVCATHKKTFLYYCSRCECLTCVDCMTSNHNEHKTEKIKNVADARRENVNQIIEQLKTKVAIVEKKLAIIDETHASQIKTDCKLYVKGVEDTTRELHNIIDRHKKISSTTATDFQYFENQNLDGRRTFFKRHHNETADRISKFENLLRETHDSTFLTEWKALQSEVQVINEETDVPLLDPTGIENFNQEVFTRSVVEEIDEHFQMRLKEQEKAVDSLTDQIDVLQNELTRKQEEIDELLKLSGRLKEKEKKVNDLSEENENLKTNIKQRKKDELSKLKEQEKTVTSLKNDMAVLQNKLTKKQEEVNDLLKLSAQLKEKEGKVTELSEENENLKTNIKQRKQDELSKLSGQLKEKERKVTELWEENENIKTGMTQRKQDELFEIRIALVGARRSGKSSLGNTLVGWDAFPTFACIESVTNICRHASTVLPSGKPIQVVDTPGITNSKDRAVVNEIKRSIGILHPGPHAFLLVMQPDRSLQEDIKALKELKNVFGDSYLQITIMIMVCRNQICHKDSSLMDIHEFIARTKCKEIQEVYELCGQRIIAVDNRETDQLTKEKYRKQIVDMIMNLKGHYWHSK